MDNSTAQQISIAQFYNLSAASLYFPFTKKILLKRGIIMSKVKIIPNPYTAADRTLLDKIEAERPYIDELHCHPAMWWKVGGFICTQFDNGYYHCYLLKKEYPYGKILRDYYINRKGEMVEGKRYYSVPTKEDFLSWCAERGIDGTSMIVV